VDEQGEVICHLNTDIVKHWYEGHIDGIVTMKQNKNNIKLAKFISENYKLCFNCKTPMLFGDSKSLIIKMGS